MGDKRHAFTASGRVAVLRRGAHVATHAVLSYSVERADVSVSVYINVYVNVYVTLRLPLCRNNHKQAHNKTQLSTTIIQKAIHKAS